MAVYPPRGLPYAPYVYADFASCKVVVMGAAAAVVEMMVMVVVVMVIVVVVRLVVRW